MGAFCSFVAIAHWSREAQVRTGQGAPRGQPPSSEGQWPQTQVPQVAQEVDMSSRTSIALGPCPPREQRLLQQEDPERKQGLSCAVGPLLARPLGRGGAGDGAGTRERGWASPVLVHLGEVGCRVGSEGAQGQPPRKRMQRAGGGGGRVLSGPGAGEPWMSDVPAASAEQAFACAQGALSGGTQAHEDI